MPFERSSIGRFANCDTRAHRSNKFVDASVVRLTYLLLMHEEAYQAIRLIEALQEPQHNFVIHVDGKAASNETYYQMMDYAASYSNVHMITGAQRVNVSWGGFNVVQGTLNGIMYAVQKGIPFHWLVTLSGYTYPLVSNQKIRETLAKYPVDTNFLEMSPRPNRPAPRTWHNFVECDNQMRRIARLATPVDFSLHVGSQWLLISSAFANYLVSRGNFADKYRVYGKHTMVADENYFVTVLRNSEFCHTHENTNFAQVQFDEWEHDKANGPNVNKCLQPNPDHCGRSPTIIDLAFLPVLELSGAMFARKFDPEIDHRSIDAIDIMRSRDSSSNSGSWSLGGGGGGGDQGLKTRHFEDVVITTTAGPLTSQSMCVDLSQQANSKARVTSCTRGKLSQHFSLGPCSSDGSLDFSTEAEHQLLAQQGEFSRPYCLVRSKAGNAETQTSGCLDVERESVQPGTKLISFYCRNTKWNQLFTFGPNGSIQINIPLFRYRDRKMCLEAETGEVGAEIVLADCDVTEPRQRFYFHDS
uniref:protein xylosyltransferase n=1 Tax=Octactis speculum TaxID=3111310 RepID=A0A7S2AW29_9STRA